MFYRRQSYPRYAVLLLLAVLGFGLVSTFFADFPVWALKEWARYAGLFILAMVIAYSARQAWF